ncbi:hypothetical protein [Sphingomonas crocodyli]|uniref:Uncharacterized protein n=1 Tax=Sphingomonas crocodyli TaxID=1979270 RepID=A0A437M9I8_9SPHN|nr:hypothetical protein [Sphingomonas crocodyli]RVT94380.1 hypothetical protein EOD43_11210 [Sphingomonas crocodyli]
MIEAAGNASTTTTASSGSGYGSSIGALSDALISQSQGLGGLDTGKLASSLDSIQAQDPALAGQLRGELAARLSPVEAGALLRVSGEMQAPVLLAASPVQGDVACPSPGMTPAEQAAAARGDREAFWASRAERGDPLGATALQIVRNDSFNGQVANGRLYNAIAERTVFSGNWPDGAKINAEIQQIGVELMRAHADAVTRFGNPTAEDVARYHHQVFADHGLDPRTFGGTMLTGTVGEANAYSWVWRSCP